LSLELESSAGFLRAISFSRSSNRFSSSSAPASREACRNLSIWGFLAMPRDSWVPRQFERHLFHEVYIDETSQNDHHFLVLGGIMVPREVSAAFEADILEARRPRLRSVSSKGQLREIGWSEVSNGDFEAYQKVLDAFFSFAFRHMQGKTGLVRSYLSVVNLRVKGRSYAKGKRGQIGFNREIYFHSLSVARRHKLQLFHVYPDSRINQTPIKTKSFCATTCCQRLALTNLSVRTRSARKLSERTNFGFADTKLNWSHHLHRASPVPVFHGSVPRS
jgi:hypothetical protein